MEDNNSINNLVGNVVGIPSTARGLHVLVVDYDTTSLMYIASELEEHSYRVTTTELACIALAMIRERKGEFDLVMADLNMQEIDVSEYIKQIQLHCQVPIILMSPNATMEVAQDAISKGACFFFWKPIRTRDIKNVWQHVFRKRLGSPTSETTDVEKTDANPSRNTGKNLVRDQNKEENGKKSKQRAELSGSSDSSPGARTEKIKRPRLIWSPELDCKFVLAINQLGEENAHPKALLTLMNEPNLTHRHVASHLQKYRERKKQLESLLGKIRRYSSNNYGGTNYAAAPNATPQIPTHIPWPNSSSSVCYNIETVKNKLNSMNSTRKSTPNTSSFNSINNGEVEAAAGNYDGNPNAKGKETLGFPESFGQSQSMQYPRLNLDEGMSAPPNNALNPVDLVVGEHDNYGINFENAINVEEGHHGGANQEADAMEGVDDSDDDIDVDSLLQMLDADGVNVKELPSGYDDLFPSEDNIDRTSNSQP